MSAHLMPKDASSATATEAPLHFVDPRAFKARTREAVDDVHLRRSFRSAKDFLQAKRAAHFSDAASFDALRHVGAAIRQYSLSRLPDLLERLEQRLTERGVQVHWASTPQETNTIFLALARAQGANRMVKGKSMVSEEIELNHRMAEAGVSCLESDMGEYIVQLAGERPSHIIMPAIHAAVQPAHALLCPVGIPIPELLMQLRHDAKHEPAPRHPPLAGQGSAKDWREALTWKIWAWLNERPRLYRGALSLGHRLHALVPAWLGGWTAHRTPMRPAARGLRERLAAQQRREG